MKNSFTPAKDYGNNLGKHTNLISAESQPEILDNIAELADYSQSSFTNKPFYTVE